MTLALILVRWLHLSSSILLAGLFVFEATILVPATNKTSEATGRLLDAIRRVILRTAFWTLLVAFITWLAWSWLVASIMGGDDLMECLQSGDLLTVLTRTQFGHIWLLRMIVSLLFAINLWVVARTEVRRSFFQTTLAGLSVIELVSLAWVGHAAASLGVFGIVHLLGDGVHLLALAFWPGELAPLAAFLLLLLKSRQFEAIALASPVVRRFSASSLIAVAVLAFTGISNSIFMVGSFRALLTSIYGQILISKLILFFAMIGFGALNLFLLKRRIAVGPPTVHLEEKSALRLLIRNVLCEIGLGTFVILIVGLLGIAPPPMR
jgi:copper resistance protein D